MAFFDADQAVKFATCDATGVQGIDYSTRIPGLGRLGRQERLHLRSRILAVLGHIDRLDANAYAMRCQGFSFSQIGKALGVSASTAQRRSAKARAAITPRLVQLQIVEGWAIEDDDQYPTADVRSWQAS